jgi:hypothetical protein
MYYGDNCGDTGTREITREQAMDYLSFEPEFDLSRLKGMQYGFGSRITSRDEFKKYNFKRWRWVVYLMWKSGVVPETFYKKYAC